MTRSPTVILTLFLLFSVLSTGLANVSWTNLFPPSLILLANCVIGDLSVTRMAFALPLATIIGGCIGVVLHKKKQDN